MTAAFTEIQTATGEFFDYAHFSETDIHEEDIAHALSMICRFNGHCLKFYSVAKHLCLVHDLMEYDRVEMKKPLTREDVFHGLIHDVGEAYLTDIPRPLKNYFTQSTEFTAFMDDYIDIENRIIEGFARKYPYGKHAPHAATVKYYDTWALLLEQKYLMTKTKKEWSISIADYPDEPHFVKGMMNPFLYEKDWAREFMNRLEYYNEVA
jgi:hypothetical protein